MLKLRAFALLLFCLVSVGFARAQDAPTPADLADWGEAATPITEMRAVKNKTVVIVFDVSGSMNDNGNLRRARAATVNILRNGAGVGDHVALLTFGAGYKKVFDTTLESRADLPALIEQVPSRTEAGAGTNIRKPHHEALKMVNSRLPRPGVIVLLTDSFNDEPKPDDGEYANYLKYYTPGGHLTRYPATPENADYERLLQKLGASGQLTQYGVGIKVADDGRPIERLPQAAPPPVEAPPDPSENAPRPTPPPDKGISPALLWGGLAALLLAGGGAAFALTQGKAAPLRITGGPGGTKDYQIKSGQTVRLGGEGARHAFDAYDLAAPGEAVAVIRGAGGQFTLAPGGAATAGAKPPTVAAGSAAPTGNQTGGVRVYHNGLLLERPTPLRYGDEVRVSVPPAGGAGMAKEYRLRFDDPRKSF